MTMDVGSKKVYLEDLEAEVRGKVERFAKDGRIPVDRLNEVLAAIDAAPVDANTIDPEDKGFFTVDEFFTWFRHDEPHDDHIVVEEHPAVTAGLKEEGDVGGTGLQWDVPDDTVDPASGDEAMR